MKKEKKELTFRSEIAKRFFHFFNEKFKEKELDKREVGEAFGMTGNYVYGFWSSLAEGTINPSIEHVKIACEKYGLSLGFVMALDNHSPMMHIDTYDMSNNSLSQMSEEQSSYGEELSVGEVIDAILHKHKTPRQEYAQKLGMTPRNLQKIIAGEINPSFDVVMKIANDHGERLDLFQNKMRMKQYVSKSEQWDKIQEAVKKLRNLYGD